MFTIFVSCRPLLDSSPTEEIFERTTKYINHPNLMPDLYKDLEVTELDERLAIHTGTQNDRNSPDNVTHDYRLHSRMAHRLK